MKVTAWKAWYSTPDGKAISMYCSPQTSWEDLPSVGVQVVMLYLEKRSSDFYYRRCMAGDCYYWYENEGKNEEDWKTFGDSPGYTEWGTCKFNPPNINSSRLKLGCWIKPDEKFEAILKIAMAEECICS